MTIFHKFVIIILSGLLVIVTLAFGSLLYKTRKEHKAFLQHEAKLYIELTSLQKVLEAQESYLNKLTSDSAFYERVVRQKLGYSAPNELIFKFQDSE